MLEMLDAFIGLMFVYLILSLIVTTAMEFWVQFRGLRGHNLRQTLERLFLDEWDKPAPASTTPNDNKNEVDLLDLFYDHPRVQALKSGNHSLPSYIPKDIFLDVLMDLITRRVLKRDTLSFAHFRQSPHRIEQILERFQRQERNGRYSKLAHTLRTFWVDAGANPAAFRTCLDTWFEHTQERASGWFKRILSVRLFILGLVLAVLTNADTLHMFKVLTANDTLRAEYVRKALDASALDDFSSLSTLQCSAQENDIACSQLTMVKQAAAEIAPLLGWSDASLQRFKAMESPLALLSSLIGWILTAIALSLGAPFWFDMLQKVVRVRSSLKPASNRDIPLETAENSAEPNHGVVMTTSAQATLPAHFAEEDFSQFQPHAKRYQLINAFWMTRFAELAYQDERVIKARCQSWDLACETYSITADKVDTQFFLCYDKNTLVICFRGTEPDNWADIQTDADFMQVACVWNNHFQVHLGFQRALDAAWSQLLARINVLHKGRYVWISGHSLGGALAMLATHRLYHESRHDPHLQDLLIGGLYTSGQPRCANRAFAQDLEHALGERICRVVNNRDAVTLLPPPVAYAHAGSTLYITETGSLMLDPPFWYRVLDKVEVINDKTKLKRSLQETVSDHSISLYVRLLATAARHQGT
jgi:hypothetical protein